MPLAFLLSLLLPPLASAFLVEPMVLSVPVSEARAAGTFTVENNSAEKVALEFRVTDRRIDAEGAETRSPAPGFLLYPQQLKLEPGEKRSVRVSWNGQKMPAEEMAYRFVATQLPVDFSKEKAGNNIKFLLEYVASLYLTPKNSRPRLRVAKQQVNSRGELEITVKNEGSAHGLLEKMDLSVAAGAKKFTPSAPVLAELRTANILPGAERILRVKLPKGFGKESQGSIHFGE